MTNAYQGYLLIADITGYTLYLSESELEHAQEILSVLLDLLLKHTRPPLMVSRLAGDAVISYGLAGQFFQGQTFIELIEDTYVAFRKAIEQILLNNTCGCAACKNVSTLDLKFFVHYGQFAIQRISDHDELVGSDVNLIHRLLKNQVTEKIGLRAYVLYTDSALRQLGLESIEDGMQPIVEEYEHLGTVTAWVQDLSAVWDQKRAANQVVLTAEETMAAFEVDLNMPVEVAWDYLVQPDYIKILLGVHRIEYNGKQQGRITSGSGYTCYHGDKPSSVVILEWRPFQNILTKSPLPIPAADAQILIDYRVRPTEQGTHLVQAFSKVKGSFWVRTVMWLMGPELNRQGKRDIMAFKKAVEADLADRQTKKAGD